MSEPPNFPQAEHLGTRRRFWRLSKIERLRSAPAQASCPSTRPILSMSVFLTPPGKVRFGMSVKMWLWPPLQPQDSEGSVIRHDLHHKRNRRAGARARAVRRSVRLDGSNSFAISPIRSIGEPARRALHMQGGRRMTALTLPRRRRGRQGAAQKPISCSARDLLRNILQIRSTLDFAVSSAAGRTSSKYRGVITKDEIERLPRTNQRLPKTGELPLDICAVDQSRSFDCLERVDGTARPLRLD